MKLTHRIFALCLLIAPLAAKAQLGSHLGITAGPAMTHFMGDNSTLDPRFGYSAGLVYQYAFSSRYALHTGLLYESKGAMDTYDLFFTEVHANYNFNYLTLPILFRYHFRPETKLRPYLNAGPYAAFLINQNTVTRVGDSDDKERDNNTDNFTRFDAGVTAGVGIDYLINNNTHLDFEIRDNLGFINVNESGNNTSQNNNIAFMVSLFFSIPPGD